MTNPVTPPRRPRNNAEAWVQAAKRTRQKTRADDKARKARLRSDVVVMPSAGILATGLVLLVVGGVLYSSGFRSSIEYAMTSSRYVSDGGSAMTFGVILTLAGLILTIVGVYRLARNVDRLAQRSAEAGPTQG